MARVAVSSPASADFETIVRNLALYAGARVAARYGAIFGRFFVGSPCSPMAAGRVRRWVPTSTWASSRPMSWSMNMIRSTTRFWFFVLFTGDAEYPAN